LFSGSELLNKARVTFRKGTAIRSYCCHCLPSSPYFLPPVVTQCTSTQQQRSTGWRHSQLGVHINASHKVRKKGAEQKRCGVRFGRADGQASVARSAVFRKTAQVWRVPAGWRSSSPYYSGTASAASSTVTVTLLGYGSISTLVL
jgi:hypothetical protein